MWTPATTLTSGRLTRARRAELLDQDLAYTAGQLDRDVVSIDQIRTVIRTFKERLFTEIFPGRTHVPKTLIFAKDDNYAEEIIHAMREVFGQGDDLTKKIAYQSIKKPKELIRAFRAYSFPCIHRYDRALLAFPTLPRSPRLSGRIDGEADSAGMVFRCFQSNLTRQN